jgi:hypothetical protein
VAGALHGDRLDTTVTLIGRHAINFTAPRALRAAARIRPGRGLSTATTAAPPSSPRRLPGSIDEAALADQPADILTDRSRADR